MHKGGLIRFLINAVIFILLEVAALTMLRNNAPLQEAWFAKGGQNVMNTVWGWSQGVSDYFSLKGQNDSLALENLNLRTRVASLENYISDSLLSARICIPSESTGFTYIPATINKISNNTQHNYIIVSKGWKHGVCKGDGIITGQGAIGVVDAVSENFCFVRSFKNHGMSISARLGRKGVSGPLRWDGIHSNGALLSEIPHHICVSPGDTVYTSGFSSIFPADIPLGVVKDSRIVNGSTYEVKVRMFEDFGALRYVTVVRNNDKDEINALEGTR
ncbi:MAG: rod shape-determining protein MreC [Bacteroidales bacterium]|nr:rod shape-determining protein MreC [Bacteroidales bacterium]